MVVVLVLVVVVVLQENDLLGFDLRKPKVRIPSRSGRQIWGIMISGEHVDGELGGKQ